MNPETRFSAHWIVAAQGMGKTNLLLHMLAADIERGASIITLDSKGELTNILRHLYLGDRLIVIDPKNPLAINPLDVPEGEVTQAIDRIFYIFGALLEANITPKQEAFLRPVLRALITAHPAPTLPVLQGLLNSRNPRGEFTHLPEDLQEFFDVEWRDYDTTRTELKWRMRLLLENSLIRNVLSAPRTRFRLSDAMDSGKIVVVDNSQAVIGGPGSKFLGRYIISQVWEAATARATRHTQYKLPVYLYIDEADLVIDKMIAAIIDQCRSQKIALVLAHQRMGQIADLNVLSALENCAIKMANVDPEAPYFSKLLHIPEERINKLPQGHFAMHVRGEGSSITEVPLASFPFRRMSAIEERQLSQRMQYLYGSVVEQRPPVEQGMPPPPPPPPKQPPPAPSKQANRPQQPTDKKTPPATTPEEAKAQPQPSPAQPTVSSLPNRLGSYDWDVTISPRVAEQGGTIQIVVQKNGRPTQYNVKIPRHTKNNTVMRLAGFGYMRPDNTIGDLYLTIKVPPAPITDSRPGGSSEW